MHVKTNITGGVRHCQGGGNKGRARVTQVKSRSSSKIQSLPGEAAQIFSVMNIDLHRSLDSVHLDWRILYRRYHHLEPHLWKAVYINFQDY